MSELALKRIAEAKEKRLTRLDLANCGLIELPNELFELSWLEALMLSDGEIWDSTKKEMITFSSQNKGSLNNIFVLAPKINQLINLKTLVANGDWSKKCGITDISPLTNLVNLECLSINKAHVKDLQPLKNFTNLQSLSIDDTMVTDLQPLVNLMNLQVLSMNGVKIKDLTFLQKFISLESLNIDVTSAKDINPIENLTDLHTLSIYNQSFDGFMIRFGYDSRFSTNSTNTSIQNLDVLAKLAKLKHLSIHNIQITDLSFLQGLTKLQQFTISNPNIDNLNQLNALNLRELKFLSIHSNAISDWEPLQNLITLEKLSMSGDQLTNLHPLEHLVNLQNLTISSKKLSNLNSLSKLVNLQKLTLSSDEIIDINPIKYLANLHKFRISSDKITQLDALANFVKLQDLSISGNKIKDLTSIKSLTDLKKLSISCEVLEELTFLKLLTGLKSCTISSGKISDLSALKYLNVLKSCSISCKEVSDLKPLKDLVTLKTLSLRCKKITDLNPLKNLINLQNIDVSNTQVTELSALEHLIKLQVVNIGDTNVNSLEPLKNLLNLKLLQFRNTKVSDLSPLKNLTRITSLNIFGTKLQNLDSLKELVQLESLSFRIKQTDRTEVTQVDLNVFMLKDEEKIPQFDLNPLRNLIKLHSLDIQANNIGDLSSLKNLIRLNHLSITGERINDLSPLKNFKNLLSLFISSKEIKDLNPLGDLKSLQKLSILKHQVTDLNPLKNLTNLTSLAIGGSNDYYFDSNMYIRHFMDHHEFLMGGQKSQLSNLSDLSVLKDLTKLESFYLMDTEVSDLRPLQNLGHLKKLYLFNNKVSDLSPLAYLVNLQSLNFVKNPVRTIEPLKRLVNLSLVEFSNTLVKDINPLENLINLSSIACQNTLVADLGPLKNLTNLQSISIQSTLVTNLSPLKNLTNLQALNFRNCNINDIEPLKNLINLRSLVAGTNTLRDLNALKYLVNLSQLDINPTNPLKDSEILDIGSNAAKYLSHVNVNVNPVVDLAPLQNLHNLVWFDMSNTNINDLTPLKHLLKLQGVNLDNTQVRDLTPLRNLIKKGGHISGVDNCRLSPLLKAAYKKGTDAVIKYLDKRKKDLFEARVLILGEPRAGKTTLRRKLKNTNAPMPDATESTKAFEIEVDPYKISVQNKGKTEKLTYHLWDFGGQEYYRLLHQLFVTEQCVYIIVTDTDRNKNEEEIDFWLETIERLSKDAHGKCAPVVLLQNPKTNRDGNDFTSLKKRYPFWQQHEPFVINLNALDNRNTKTFQQTHFDRFVHFKSNLEKLFFQLDHVGMEIFAEWYPIRRTLSLKKKDYISIEMFREICTKKGVSDVSEQEYLLYIFHTLGFLQYYQNAPALKDMVILNREWVTDALYRVLDHETVRNNKGWFTHADVPEIWNDVQYRDKTHALLGLMQEFKLSYFNDVSRKYIVPAKLPEDTEGLPNWDLTQNVHLHLQYEWLPLAVTTQLVVLLHEHIVPFKKVEHWIWRKGAVIDGRKLDLADTQVQIEENTKKNYISIRARGADSETLIRIVRQKWQEVHVPFEHKVTVSTIILCGCETCLKSSTPQKFKYENVLKAKALHAPLQCHESFKSFSAQDILKGIFGEFKVLVDSGALKELIKKGRIKDALELLPNDDMAMQLQGSYTRLSEAMMRNTVSFQEKEIEMAKITDRLMKYLKENQF